MVAANYQLLLVHCTRAIFVSSCIIPILWRRVVSFECPPSVEWKSFSLAGYLIELFTDTVVSRWLLRLLLALRASIPGALWTKLQQISPGMPMPQTVTCLHATKEVSPWLILFEKSHFGRFRGKRVFTNSSGISNRPPHKSFARTSHNIPQGVVNNSQPGVVGLLANGHVQRKQHFSVVWFRAQ